MGEGTKVVDTDARVDALSKRLADLEHRVLELEYRNQQKEGLKHIMQTLGRGSPYDK